MKLAILIVIVVLLQLVSSGKLVMNPRAIYSVRYTRRVVVRPYFNPTICGYEVDAHLRYKYWYYLPSARLSYVTHIT